ncbi:MAG TPA: nucleotide exchange factor GrpE [Thermodesulfobacteriota bacterium]|nr:nucleotide exchange factor GrpE [Thermodesulfobacteriota bacterium]
MKKENKTHGKDQAPAGAPVKDDSDGHAEKTPETKEGTPLEKIQAQLEEKTKEAADTFDKWLRLRAEFENYKRRMQKEREDSIRYGNENLLKALLPVIDNLNRAIEHAKDGGDVAGLREGVEMVRKQFLTVLEKFGVKPVAAVGETFDPEKHEAIAQAEGDEPNRVLSAAEEGYLFHDRLLRPAKVVVSRGKVEHGTGAS